MKKVVLYSLRQDVGAHYVQDLQLLFGGKVELGLCALGSLAQDDADIDIPPQGRPTDIALVTNPEQVRHIRRQLHAGSYIVSVDFSYSLQNIERLRAYPDGTRARLTTAYPNVRKNLIRLFYEQGIHNLIWVDEHSSAPFDLLVIDNLSPRPLPAAPQVANLGRRNIAFSTLLQVASTAGILDAALERRLFEYVDGYRGSLSIFPFLYSDMSSSNSQLLAVLNGINDAVAIFDHRRCIVHCNRSFTTLFPQAEQARNTPVERLAQLRFFAPILRNTEPVKDLLVEAGARGEVVVSTEQISSGLTASMRTILIVQPLRDVEHREKAVRHQLAQRGYRARYSFADIRSASAQMNRCLEKAHIIAGIDKTTLVVGESGVGKELLVQAIHSASARTGFPFVSINCAALPAALLESELFGYSEGAFTGSKRGGKRGLFELAHRGTLFLDEIGETSLEVQSKLLRAIETKEIMPVGGDAITTVDVRIIAATNQNLRELVRQKKFRLDLYYRLSAIILQIPPLRHRSEDILMLADYFIRQETGAPRPMTPALRQFLTDSHWEGNVRELRNVVEYMANIASGPLGIEHLPDYVLDELPAVPPQGDSSTLCAQQPLAFRERYSRAEQRRILLLLQLLQDGVRSRAALLQRLAQSGPQHACSAYRLREYLQTLRADGLLDYGKGPTGIVLLPAGRAVLENAAHAGNTPSA